MQEAEAKALRPGQEIYASGRGHKQEHPNQPVVAKEVLDPRWRGKVYMIGSQQAVVDFREHGIGYDTVLFEHLHHKPHPEES